jgi:hypothetical protein
MSQVSKATHTRGFLRIALSVNSESYKRSGGTFSMSK